MDTTGENRAFQTVTEEGEHRCEWEKVQDRDYGNDICVLHARPTDSGKAVGSDTASSAEKAAYLQQCGSCALFAPGKAGPN